MASERWGWGWAANRDWAVQALAAAVVRASGDAGAFPGRIDVIAPFQVDIAGLEDGPWAWAAAWPHMDLSQAKAGDFVCQLAPGLRDRSQPLGDFTLSLSLSPERSLLLSLSTVSRCVQVARINMVGVPPIDVRLEFGLPVRKVLAVGFEDGILGDLGRSPEDQVFVMQDEVS